MTKRPRRHVTIDLGGRAAIVTGGSRGIGRACVEILAAAGADVVFSYNRHAASAREVVRRVKQAGGRAFAVRADVSRAGDCRALVATTLRRLGRVDILVNNAGIWEPPGGIAIETISDAHWARTLRVNLDGAFYCTRAVVPAMKARRFGRIICLSSTAGQRGEDLHSDYASSKGALISFTKSLATELGPHGILVNAIAPWWVRTDMSREILDRPGRGAGEAAGEASPLGRVAMPEEIAGPVLFLCSDLARYITGEILNVNGGTILCG
ncbi:MAG TPA: SDR family oxidoreductase [Candidatus Polarisedimenticolia bacterium]|nr:SDR family oxidoreductase [Candidatus Polarisedimenticolia bacterium]